MPGQISQPIPAGAAVAAGLDIGGSKIEAQVFDAGWQVLRRHRVPTPHGYDDLIVAIDAMIGVIGAAAGPVPVGVCSAGRVNPATGLALGANLPITGKPFPADLARVVGRRVPLINDAAAFALSEALTGAGQGADPVLGLVLGTGVGAGLVAGGRLVTRTGGIAGEIGHLPMPAPLVAALDLPLLHCGCGAHGCFETLISGPGLARLAERLTGERLTPEALAKRQEADRGAARVLDLWCRIVAELLHAVVLTTDPEVIVLGGGLSRMPGVAERIAQALAPLGFPGFPRPRIVIAQGGDASGARGAAIAAWQGAQDG